MTGTPPQLDLRTLMTIVGPTKGCEDTQMHFYSCTTPARAGTTMNSVISQHSASEVTYNNDEIANR